MKMKMYESGSSGKREPKKTEGKTDRKQGGHCHFKTPLLPMLTSFEKHIPQFLNIVGIFLCKQLSQLHTICESRESCLLEIREVHSVPILELEGP
jgi:hypothetical protein